MKETLFKVYISLGQKVGKQKSAIVVKWGKIQPFF